MNEGKNGVVNTTETVYFYLTGFKGGRFMSMAINLLHVLELKIIAGVKILIIIPNVCRRFGPGPYISGIFALRYDASCMHRAKSIYRYKTITGLNNGMSFSIEKPSEGFP